MAIPKPEPRDWQIANARELQVTDREVLRMLREAKKRVDAILKELPAGKQEVRRAQLEQTRARLLTEQADVFERLGDIVSARRARAASRSAGLSAAGDAALLSLVGKGPQGQYLYESALQVGQRQIDAAMARMKLSQVPLSQRIYRTGVWMGSRLNRLINETLATGLNAQEFARRARDWFNPNTPGGVRYAALRLARTEINNAFHAMSAAKYADTPWIKEVDWNLSKSHPKFDVCNEVAFDSPYPADRVPVRPHPQCMCYITPKAISEDDFIENFLKGDYDDYLDEELAKAGYVEPEPQPASAPKSITAPVKPPAEEKPNQADDIARKAESEYTPYSRRTAELNDFFKRRVEAQLFGFNDGELGSALDRPQPEVYDKLLDVMLQALGTTSKTMPMLDMLRHADKAYAERTGQENQNWFERGMVEFLTTPDGEAKAQEGDQKFASELLKFAEADKLTRAAEELNGKQPQLPADSQQYQSLTPNKAAELWSRLIAAKPLTPDDNSGLRYYSTTPGYTGMNGFLRYGRKQAAKTQAKVEDGIRNTRSALRPLDEPVLVTRMTAAGQFTAEGGIHQRLDSLLGLTGRTFKDNGFTSTAVQGGKLTAGDVRLEIELPVGVPVAYMESITKHKGENELMLVDGLEFTVLRSEMTVGADGRPQVLMRIRAVNWPGKIS